jgi:hypothetical protein
LITVYSEKKIQRSMVQSQVQPWVELWIICSFSALIFYTIPDVIIVE